MENDKSSIAFTDNDILFIKLKLSQNFIKKSWCEFQYPPETKI